MNPDTLQKLKSLLETERSRLLHIHNQHEESLREVNTSGDIAGPERAAELHESRLGSQIVESEELLLEKVVHALERIDEGTYGICKSCEKAIPVARLQAKPSVSLCVPCQEAKESA